MIGLAKTAAGQGHLELTERPDPTPASDQVLLDVLGAGVCGTDLHIEAGEYAAQVPVTLGHEVCGVVRAVGDRVDPAWIDARVVCETFFSTCGRCRMCLESRPNLCPTRRSIGTHVDGGFAARMVVPETNLHRVPAWLDDHSPVLTEPLACVCHAMLSPRTVEPGDAVLVVGPGPVGLLAAQVARAQGGKVQVCGLPRDSERLEIAGRLGLDAFDHVPTVDEIDVAVEASGTGAGLATCLERVRRGGRVVQLGIYGRPVTVPLDLVLTKEIRLSTGFASTPRAWDQACELIEQGAVQLRELVSDVVPLHEWPRVFDELRAGRGMKIVLDPQAPRR